VVCFEARTAFFKHYLDELSFEGLITDKKCDLINKQYNMLLQRFENNMSMQHL
jgi:hypothetical protein